MKPFHVLKANSWMLVAWAIIETQERIETQAQGPSLMAEDKGVICENRGESGCETARFWRAKAKR